VANLADDDLQRAFVRLAAQVEWLKKDASADERQLATGILHRWNEVDVRPPFNSTHRDALDRLALLLFARGPMSISAMLVSLPLRVRAVRDGEGTIQAVLDDVLVAERAGQSDPHAATLRGLLTDVPPPEQLCQLRGCELATVFSSTRAALASPEGRVLLDAISVEVAERVAAVLAARVPLADAAPYIARARARLRDGQSNAAGTDLVPEVLEQSVADVDAALGLEPNNAEATLLRARLRLMEGGSDRRFKPGTLDAAAVDVERAEALAAPAAEVWVVKAELANARRDSRGAVAAYSRALELDPGRRRLHALRGALYADLGELDAAAFDASAAIAEAPSSPTGWSVEGWVLRQRGDFLGALERFDKALSLDPTHGFSFLERSLTFSAMGDPVRALADSDRAVELVGDSTSFYNRGNLHLAMENFALAERDYSRALESDPNDLQAVLNRAAVRLQGQDFEGAIADLRRATVIRPDHPTAHMKLGLLLADFDPAQAAAELEVALQVAPADWPPRATIEETLAALR
jgi:tetratricopeptide (TPR) repeat protein